MSASLPPDIDFDAAYTAAAMGAKEAARWLRAAATSRNARTRAIALELGTSLLQASAYASAVVEPESESEPASWLDTPNAEADAGEMTSGTSSAQEDLERTATSLEDDQEPEPTQRSA
ncbi:MAG: hypothetical protein ACTHU0_21575 [Kofleriaceae bacterium]